MFAKNTKPQYHMDEIKSVSLPPLKRSEFTRLNRVTHDAVDETINMSHQSRPIATPIHLYNMYKSLFKF